MSLKLSHSSMNDYQTCPKMYEYKRVHKLVSKSKGSALFFGSAIDLALNYLLENKDAKNLKEVIAESIRIFDVNWEQAKDNEYKLIDLPRNPNIKYSKYDFDPDLLEKEDWKELFALNSNPIEHRNSIQSKLSNQDFLDLPEDERSFYNYGSWLSCKRRAKYLIEAYAEQILPEIKKVIAVQMDIKLDDGEGNMLNGVIDLVGQLPDGRIAILDNKTSSMEYEEDSVLTSPQLALYKKQLNMFNEDPDNQWKHKIDCAGFLVLSKKLNKDITKTCKSCGHIATGSHKTCDNTVNGKRCGGEWDKVKKFSVNTQIIIDSIDEHVQDMILSNADTIKICIQSKLFPQNFNSCINKYGMKCDYYDLCWNKNSKNLIKLEDKK